jgi:hypothetical protein
MQSKYRYKQRHRGCETQAKDKASLNVKLVGLYVQGLLLFAK